MKEHVCCWGFNGTCSRGLPRSTSMTLFEHLFSAYLLGSAVLFEAFFATATTTPFKSKFKKNLAPINTSIFTNKDWSGITSGTDDDEIVASLPLHESTPTFDSRSSGFFSASPEPFRPASAMSQCCNTPASLVSSASTPTVGERVRSALRIRDEKTRWFIFYLTTFPVEGLDPALWRKDQNGHLILVSLYKEKGCLAYNFDHRYPVSFIAEAALNDSLHGEEIKQLMTCPSNMQAISYRTNTFKANISELSLKSGNSNLMEEFGCDPRVMEQLTKDDCRMAKRMEQLLINDQYKSRRQFWYNEYLKALDQYETEGNFDLKITEQMKIDDPERVKRELNKRAEDVKWELSNLCKQAQTQTQKK